MKTILLVRRHHIREMVENDDTLRMLGNGDWIAIPPHLLRPPTPEALRQRRHRAKKRVERDGVMSGE